MNAHDFIKDAHFLSSLFPISLIGVGGDGTFAELLNGLLDRVNSSAGVEQNFRHKPISPDLRIGMIPGGKI